VGVSKLDGLAPWRPIEAPTRQPFTSFLHSAAGSRVTLPHLLGGALPRAPNALDPSSEFGLPECCASCIRRPVNSPKRPAKWRGPGPAKPLYLLDGQCSTIMVSYDVVRGSPTRYYGWSAERG
jgi:hypothetical protein